MKYLISLVVLLFGIFFISGSVAATPPEIPYTLSGEIQIDGTLAPLRTVIEARDSNDFVLGRFMTIKEGKYGLFNVNGDDPETEKKDGAMSGEIVTLWINGKKTSHSFTWESGGFNYRFDIDLQTDGGCTDCDGDRYFADDCNDQDSGIYPGAQETCDGIDNNCNGIIDEITRSCSSNIGECLQGTETCRNGNWQGCVDFVGPRNEICDGLDNDCDGSIDEGLSCDSSGKSRRGQSGSSYSTPTDVLRQKFPEPTIKRVNESFQEVLEDNETLPENDSKEEDLVDKQEVMKENNSPEEVFEEDNSSNIAPNLWDQFVSVISSIFSQLKEQEILGDSEELNKTNQIAKKIQENDINEVEEIVNETQDMDVEEFDVKKPRTPQIEDLEFLDCVTEWVCTSWTPCVEGKKISTCVDWNNCHPDYLDLKENILEESCEVETQDLGVDSRISAKLVESPNVGWKLVVGIVLVLFVFFKWLRWW